MPYAIRQHPHYQPLKWLATIVRCLRHHLRNLSGIIHPIMFITIIGFHRIFMAIDVLTKKQNFFKNTTHYMNFAHWLILYPVYEEKE